ncbi:putative P-type H(+)-exporting transporter [Helianthus annuus]|uniref:P-type H(+)-exporting transporter n=1 Tax=Helianthus annuus TaxID=4232 RepID=A0A9K3INK3_HELAN|nr:putative P-type H(+)-exporting transporter [Helianthus annuus]
MDLFSYLVILLNKFWSYQLFTGYFSLITQLSKLACKSGDMAFLLFNQIEVESGGMELDVVLETVPEINEVVGNASHCSNSKSYPVIVLGDSGVGKVSLMNQYPVGGVARRNAPVPPIEASEVGEPYDGQLSPAVVQKIREEVLCNGKWNEEDAYLETSSVLSYKLGDVIPVDARLLQGVDQSALIRD